MFLTLLLSHIKYGFLGMRSIGLQVKKAHWKDVLREKNDKAQNSAG